MAIDVEARIAGLAADRESGASEILATAIDILRDAVAEGVPLLPVAQGICRAQPSMAPLWTLALSVLDAGDAGHGGPLDPRLHRAVTDRLDAFAQRVRRAPAALVRVACEYLLVGARAETPIAIVTISFSRSVARVIEAIAQQHPVHVACGEGRPAFEGRRLAAELAAAEIPLTFFTDAALGHALDGASCVLVGADAVTPSAFINKSGTRLLAAAAQHAGVPVYVAATREKFVNRDVAARLAHRDAAPAEVWDAAPRGATVRNPYFESIPLDLVSMLLTDTGTFGSSLAPEVCESRELDVNNDLINKLGR